MGRLGKRREKLDGKTEREIRDAKRRRRDGWKARRGVVKRLIRRVYAALSAFGFQRSSTFSIVPPFVSGISFQAKKNWSAVIDAKK